MSIDLDIPTIRFVEPLAGFPALERFALVRLDDAGVLCELRALDRDVHFLVAPPQAFVTGYAPELPEAAATSLHLTSADEAVVLGIITVGDSAASSTINLAAPVIVNAPLRIAAQVVLPGADDDAVRTPLAPLVTV